MRIELEGTTFCVTGNFDHHQNTRTVEAALRAKGGKTTKSMAIKTQVLVCGSGYAPKKSTAHDRGLPVLNEAELDTLLKEGFVEIDFTPPGAVEGDENVDDLLGEVRGVLARGACSATWRDLVALLDRCQPEQAETLAAYVDDHVSRWTRREQLCCVAPRAWIINMANGQDSPLYRILRRLDLDGVDINGTAAGKVLANDSLVNIRYLDLAVDKKLSKTLFKKLGKDPKFATVEHLALGYFESSWVEHLDEGGALTSLRSLGFYPHDYWRVEDSAYAKLFALKVCEEVERVTFYSRHSWGSSASSILGLLQDANLLPSFSHLSLDLLRFGKCTNNPATSDTVSWIIDHTQGRSNEAANARIETMTVASTLFGYISGGGVAMNFTPAPNLKTLRLYTFGGRSEGAIDQAEAVFHADKMRFPDALERICTNVPIDQGAFKRLAAKRDDIELVYDPLPEPFAP